MDEPDELSEAQVDELLAALRALEDELRATLDGRMKAEAVTLDQPIGRGSRVDALQQKAMQEASRRSMGLRLQQVRAALAAASRDEYGLCRSCEEPIGYRRLRARPETPLCLRCQAGRER